MEIGNKNRRGLQVLVHTYACYIGRKSLNTYATRVVTERVVGLTHSTPSAGCSGRTLGRGAGRSVP